MGFAGQVRAAMLRRCSTTLWRWGSMPARLCAAWQLCQCVRVSTTGRLPRISALLSAVRLDVAGLDVWHKEVLWAVAAEGAS